MLFSFTCSGGAAERCCIQELVLAVWRTGERKRKKYETENLDRPIVLRMELYEAHTTRVSPASKPLVMA